MSCAALAVLAGCSGASPPSRVEVGAATPLSERRPVVRYESGAAGERERERREAAAAGSESPPQRAPERSVPSVSDDVFAAEEGEAPAAPVVGAEEPSPGSAPPPSDAEDDEAVVRALLERLCGEVEDAKKAYREVWKIDARLLPRLLLEVENPAATRLTQVDVLVRQKDFARYNEKEGRWYYFIKGLGRFELDDVAMREVERPDGRKEARVRLKKFDGFPVGVVLRAGLLNRFYSLHFPPYDDRKDLVRWWEDYYRRTVAAERREREASEATSPPR